MSWASLLRETARSSGVRPASGQARGADLTNRAFLEWRRSRRAGDPRAVAETQTSDSRAAAPDTLDERLWRALLDPRADIELALHECDASARLEADRGSLLPQGLYRTIEVWTESELSSLHALWWLARRDSKPSWEARAMGAVRWHIEHLQPDNATNRPWCAHLFVLLALGGVGEAELYAQTLLHNCRVSQGVPDPLSAEILLDCAEALEETTSV